MRAAALSVSQRLARYRQDCQTFPADAALAYRIEGLQGVWSTIAARTVHRIVRAGQAILFAQSLDQAPEVTCPPGVAITTLAEDDWPALATLITSRHLQRFRTLAKAGRHCVVAWRGTRPIGYGWVAGSLGPDVTACTFSLPPDAAYLWELYVIPSERCNGTGSALASARIQKARALGFREGWRMIAPSNLPSLRTLQKAGGTFRVVVELRFVKLLNRSYVRFAPAIEGH
jgi:GNAT superfamily N-acetyltransferase